MYVLPETYKTLLESGYLSDYSGNEKTSTINFAIDDTIAQFLIDLIDSSPNLNYMELSQILLLQAGRFLMKPVKDELEVPN